MKALNVSVLSTLLLVMLYGCGGEPTFTDAECESGNAPTTITNLDVTGSIAPSGGLPVIDDSNSFSIGWDAETSCSYTYTLTLSENAVLADMDDIVIDSGTCGFGLSCREFADIDCSLSTDTSTGDHFIACGTSTSGVEVSSILDMASSPSVNVYFYLTVTNEAALMSASTSSQATINY